MNEHRHNLSSFEEYVKRKREQDNFERELLAFTPNITPIEFTAVDRTMCICIQYSFVAEMGLGDTFVGDSENGVLKKVSGMPPFDRYYEQRMKMRYDDFSASGEKGEKSGTRFTIVNFGNMFSLYVTTLNNIPNIDIEENRKMFIETMNYSVECFYHDLRTRATEHYNEKKGVTTWQPLLH